jgi:hypothetical protein
MGKIATNVHRKDSVEQHAHKLEDGSETEGALYKPNADRTFPHTHLYQHDGKTLETGCSPIGPGHTHDYQPEPGHEVSETGGPIAVHTGPGKEIPRADSLQRTKGQWIVRSVAGAVVARGATKMDALKDYETKWGKKLSQE